LILSLSLFFTVKAETDKRDLLDIQDILNQRAPLSLGSVIQADVLDNCPLNKFKPNSTCTQIKIRCPQTVDEGLIYGVLEPCTRLKGTIVVINGGGGNNVFDNGYIEKYHKAGFRVIQLAFMSGWSLSGVGRQNLKLAACRPATALKYLFENEHYQDRSLGFCAHGHSGGGAAIGYTMTWYGGDDFLDYGQISAGPIFSNMTAGCVYPVAPQKTICPEKQNYCGQKCESFQGDVSFTHSRTPCTMVDLTGYPCACPDINPSTDAMIDWWNGQNIVSPRANLEFKHTALTSWLCKPPITNVHIGQAQTFAENIKAWNGYAQFLISNCSGSETVWNGVFQPTGESGLLVSSNVMIESCIPRHNHDSK
jgi:hypothetical protein